MSRARHSRAGMGGFTLLETMIVVTLMGGMSLLLNQALRTTWETDDYMSAAGRAKLKCERILYETASLVGESRHIFERGARGTGYVAACELRHPLAPKVRLPRVDARADLYADDAGDPRTGNMLLMVREINASPCVADRLTGKQRFIDTYRLVAVYPTLVNKSLVAPAQTARDLILWRSVSFPSRRQLLDIGDVAERRAIIRDLVGRYGYTHAWDPRAEAEVAFFPLTGFGTMADKPDADLKIAEDPVLSEGARLVYARTQLATTQSAGHRRRRAVLSADPSATWTPDGFEVKVGGTSSSRKVWIHLVLEAPAQDGRRTALHSATTVAHARDF